MSEWYIAETLDIEIDELQNEFNVYVKSNDSGNVYVTIPFKEVITMYKRIAPVLQVEILKDNK
jgi:uncharacterized FlaG/YvyC family protein